MRGRIPALALTVIAAMLPLAGCGDDDDSSGGDDSAAESGSVYGGGGSSDTDETGSAEEGAGPAEAAEAGTVEIVEFAYDPVDVTVSAGGTVEWTNSDAAPHT